MMIVAPLGQIRALLRRWEAAHVPIAVKPDGYDTVVRDLAAALDRAGIEVTRRRAHWVYELPGKVLAVLGGAAVPALGPAEPPGLAGDGFPMTPPPTDPAPLGRQKKLAPARGATRPGPTFTEADPT